MIDELIAYKHAHYPDDRRRILGCGNLGGKIRVEWLRPAAPGVDVKWETQIVRDGEGGRPRGRDTFPSESEGCRGLRRRSRWRRLQRSWGWSDLPHSPCGRVGP